MKLNRVSALHFSLLFACLAATACGGGGGGEGGGSTQQNPPPQFNIVNSGPLQMVQGVPFTYTLQTTGGTGGTETWTITSGALPSGVAMTASGVISGTPTSSNNGSFTVQVTGGTSTAVTTLGYNFTSPLVLPPFTPPHANLNIPYSVMFNSQGPNPSGWSISSGQLPPGLQLTMQQNPVYATIAGTPTQAGTFSFTVEAQSTFPAQTATLNLTIVVDSTLAIIKWNLNIAEQGMPFADSFTAVNGTPPYQWSLTGGTLGGGLSLNASTGQVTGTPASGGEFSYTITVKDSSTTPQTASQQGNLFIAYPVQLTPATFTAVINTPFTANLQASLGTPPYAWTVQSGQLPPGIALSSSGQLSGSPTQTGFFNCTVQVKDSSATPYTASATVSIDVTTPPIAFTGGGPQSPAPINGVYHSQIAVAGGTPPFTFGISAGSLPPDLTLDPTTGYIDGSPTQLGSFEFTAQVIDSASPPYKAIQPDTIQVTPALGRNDSIATATPIGNGNVVASISPYIDPVTANTANPDTDFYRLIATGGSTVHVETNAQRLNSQNPLDTVIEILDANGARLTSCTTPAFTSSCLNDDINSMTKDSALDLQVPGSSTSRTTFYVHVFDWRGDARPDMTYELEVSGVLTPLRITSSIGNAVRGSTVSEQLDTQGGTGQIMWSVSSGALPPGWTLSSTGALTGAATTDGAYTFAITATDSGSPAQTATQSFGVVITEPVTITSQATLPNACVNQLYIFDFQASGGTPPYSVSLIENGTWPSINFFPYPGELRGAPNIAGTFTGTVAVVDSSSPPGVGHQNITLTVNSCQ
ncbi:MAG TPA: putative Ig domain-containing protein [Candidatus Acidoferrales bacterium]|nr:putative Ig domain-containing protein [Candidatus Acidoferrales bacterium]